MEMLWVGALAALAAGLMTGVGALPVLAGRTLTRRSRDALLGFAAGVMISASFFSLILPGLEVAGERMTETEAALLAACGVAIGALAVALLNEVLPHEHFLKGRGG